MEYNKLSFEKERSLYNIKNSVVNECIFEGKEDGESPLKECENIKVNKSLINLRYPFWHNKNVYVNECEMKENCRAAFWYCNNLIINKVNSTGIKTVRECKNVIIKDCKFDSEEFGWKCNKLTIDNSSFTGPYFLFNTNNIKITNSTLNGKYSFQYNKNVIIDNCTFNTKDAFWHGENIVVVNSVLNGEYIGWYSKNLTLINCVINGTQPFCYCKKLKLINCQLINADFAFENSKVNAKLVGKVISIKNPLKGKIYVDEVEQIIKEDYIKEPKGKVIINNKTAK